ncbi:MAG: hypothetical protein KF893_11625 [Caldilineaceae bacterium]|nr:hypothetical protein [Caldilineaceae bacterium]
MGLQAILFISVFISILLAFIYFIRFVSRKLSGRIPPQLYDRVEQVIIGGIVVGVVSMFQPWLFVGYKYGFLVVLFSTLAFIVWSHITPSAVLYGEEEFVNVSAQEVVRKTALE